MNAKKLVVLVVAVVVGLPLALRGWRAIQPTPLTFGHIERSLSGAGLDVTPAKVTGFQHVQGAVDGRSMTVNGIQLDVFLFDDGGRLNVAYTNFQQDPGEAIANKMGITTMLGVESRARSNPRTWPVKKSKHLFVVTSDNEAAVEPVLANIRLLF
jgi:hypothetical protein